jgi:predicted nuclease of predicted toxin-antitoxin system
MKLLLDESVPKRLAGQFPGDFETMTVPQIGWAGTRNGELLRKAADAGFDALITADQGIEYQQNLSTLGLRIIVLIAPRTRLQELEPLVPKVVDVLQRESAIGVYRVAV